MELLLEAENNWLSDTDYAVYSKVDELNGHYQAYMHAIRIPS